MERTKTPPSHLQGKVGVLLFLAHLQAGQVRILELQVVLLFEILRDGALHGLSILKLQWEPVGKTGRCRQSSQLQEGERTDRAEGHIRLMTGRPARHVAHAVLPLHLAAVRHLHFQPCVVRKREKS